MADPAQRRLRADAQRNRDRIMEAARRILTEHGPHLPLEEIARQAGVSPATLYRPFANREELVHAVVEGRFADGEYVAIGEASLDQISVASDSDKASSTSTPK